VAATETNRHRPASAVGQVVFTDPKCRLQSP